MTESEPIYLVVGEQISYRDNGFIRSRSCNECRRMWDRSHPKQTKHKRSLTK